MEADEVSSPVIPSEIPTPEHPMFAHVDSNGSMYNVVANNGDSHAEDWKHNDYVSCNFNQI